MTRHSLSFMHPNDGLLESVISQEDSMMPQLEQNLIK